MPQTQKWLNIFILSGEAKLHRGLYEKQYIKGQSPLKFKTRIFQHAISRLLLHRSFLLPCDVKGLLHKQSRQTANSYYCAAIESFEVIFIENCLF
jgi:hypothetical protein